MNTHDCKAIQREIDEANLDARLTLEANEHLSRCDECRRFHADRRTLRGLMAELETVGAPADFDFRLRARLARERPSNGFHHLLLSRRPIATLALLVLIAVVAVVVKSRMSSAGDPSLAAKTPPAESQSARNAVPSNTPATPVPSTKDEPRKDVATNTNFSHRIGASTQNTGGAARNMVAQQKSPNNPNGNAPRFAIRESTGTGAVTITPDSFPGLVVVPVDGRAFKLSIDNGRGGARTISLPPVSFGSQRLIARETSFVPVSSAKGDW